MRQGATGDALRWGFFYNLDMIRMVSAIVILLGVSAVSALGQQLAPEPLSYADKVAIVESVLEATNPGSLRHIPFIRAISSENLDFVESSRFTKLGFTIVSASQMRERKKENVVDYLLFRKISIRDGVAVVKLSHVTEGRPCFAPYMYSEVSYTYEARRTGNRWFATLIGVPSPWSMMSLNWRHSAGAR